MTTIQRRRLGLTVEGVKSAGGYTLFAPQTGDGVVQLINIYGDIVHAWALPVRPGRDAVLLPNGNLGYNGSHATSAELYPAWDIWHGGHFMEAEPSGHIVWEHEDIYHHHDAQWLENGNLLYTVASPLPPKKSTLLSNIAKQSDIVKEVNREGEIVWEYVIPDFAEYPAPLNEFITGKHNSCFKAFRYEGVEWL